MEKKLRFRERLGYLLKHMPQEVSDLKFEHRLSHHQSKCPWYSRLLFLQGVGQYCTESVELYAKARHGSFQRLQSKRDKW